MVSNLLEVIAIIVSLFALVAAIPNGQKWLEHSWKAFLSDFRKSIEYWRNKLPSLLNESIDGTIHLALGLLNFAYLIFFVKTVWRLFVSSGIESIEQLLSSVIAIDTITNLGVILAISVLFAISYTLLVSIDLANRVNVLHDKLEKLSKHFEASENR